MFRRRSSSNGSSKTKKGPKSKLDKAVVKEYNATYLGSHELSPGTEIGPEACFHAMKGIQESYDGKFVDAKVALVINMYGIKAMRTSFSGITTKAAEEIGGGGGVSYDFIAKNSIFEIVFCTDIDKRFCYIASSNGGESGSGSAAAQQQNTLAVYAFKCRSKKEARAVSETVAEASARITATLDMVRRRVISAAEADSDVLSARGNGDGDGISSISGGIVAKGSKGANGKSGSSKNLDSLVDVLAYQGYSDADERFHAEVMEAAGLEPIEYNAPDPSARVEPSARTVIRQSDPNEYGRTL
eukprot:UC1_evm1s38